MYNILRIEGDPVSWILNDAQVQGAVPELGQLNGSVTLTVVAPLQGRLVLSMKSAGHVAVLAPPSGVGWIPGGIQLSRAHLYVPSATGPTAKAPGYALAQSFDLAKLEQDIVAAMRDGTFVTVEVAEADRSGVLVLNGTALPFAVLCPPTMAA
jgi:hypothetical protein